ncbi:hypothetical protein D9M71_439360 [compost metagenome]
MGDCATKRGDSDRRLDPLDRHAGQSSTKLVKANSRSGCCRQHLAKAGCELVELHNAITDSQEQLIVSLPEIVDALAISIDDRDAYRCSSLRLGHAGHCSFGGLSQHIETSTGINPTAENLAKSSCTAGGPLPKIKAQLADFG